MNRSTVRLIFGREFRELVRDRRTLLIMLGLPAVLYPAFVVVGLAFAVTMIEQRTVIGVSGIEYLPLAKEYPASVVVGGALIAEAERKWDDPPLFLDDQFHPKYVPAQKTGTRLLVTPLSSPDRGPLDRREVDAMLIVPANAMAEINRGGKPEFKVLGRDGDETSKLAVSRVGEVVAMWREQVKRVRFVRRGLPADFDQPISISHPDDAKPAETRTADELRNVLVKFLPFLLVMWSMAGALHPAIDLTAGEKERGTMETLLICPAGRGEIVAGKFLAVFAFSYGSALWNLLWMVAGAILVGFFLPVAVLSISGLAWAALLAIPLAALFSSLAIGLGAFAGSTKEGQYYLLPLMLATLPLSMYAMTPGLKLSPGLAAVPVAGLSLILQNLMAVSGEPVSTLSWFTGLGSLFICVTAALAWASWQFRRESVLFRGQSGPPWRTWFRRAR